MYLRPIFNFICGKKVGQFDESLLYIYYILRIITLILTLTLGPPLLYYWKLINCILIIYYYYYLMKKGNDKSNIY